MAHAPLPGYGHDFRKVSVHAPGANAVSVTPAPLHVQHIALALIPPLIAGGIVGAAHEAIFRESRGLTADERAYAGTIFGNSLNYDAITITRGSIAAWGASRTTGNTINL